MRNVMDLREGKPLSQEGSHAPSVLESRRLGSSADIGRKARLVAVRKSQGSARCWTRERRVWCRVEAKKVSFGTTGYTGSKPWAVKS